MSILIICSHVITQIVKTFFFENYQSFPRYMLLAFFIKARKIFRIILCITRNGFTIDALNLFSKTVYCGHEYI